MNVIELLNDKSLKAINKRVAVIGMIINDNLSLDDIIGVVNKLNDKQVGIILEAIEEITQKKQKELDSAYIDFVEKYLVSDNNSCKREASRIIGNMAQQFPHKMNNSIASLLHNAKNKSTVVRWSSAYALSRIIVLKQFYDTELFAQLSEICDHEQQNGVKNQYLKALKKVAKMRQSS